MTEQRTIDNLISMKTEIEYETDDTKQMKRIKCETIKESVSALKEIQQYRALGTVEELCEAKEKQRAKKPQFTEDKSFALCPCCNGKGLVNNQRYCDNCGQAIDWSEEE